MAAGRLRIMHAKPVEALGLHTAVVYDMIPANYYHLQTSAGTLTGCSQMKRGFGGAGERTVGSVMGSEWFEL